ncbi:helix-turn-helix domain-containing protein [Roseobacter weihaiensis]|uniref:helix-turn-helix domain-containing protein n=1 Tax=Roseobacter weihaiensis TaxID=2763262 RepID=UPI001D0B9F0C|nr:helix-turn-helix transcriptional regulator [Roseobacter sp. H9]
MQDVSVQLRSFAEKKRINQSELAVLIGVSQPTISRILRKPTVKRGPAYRKVLGFLEGATKDDSEYTSIHNGSDMLARHFENLAPVDDREAEAIDMLLTAIANYAEIKGKGAR